MRNGKINALLRNNIENCDNVYAKSSKLYNLLHSIPPYSPNLVYYKTFFSLFNIQYLYKKITWILRTDVNKLNSALMIGINVNLSHIKGGGFVKVKDKLIDK